jgi:hypothetical protein
MSKAPRQRSLDGESTLAEVITIGEEVGLGLRRIVGLCYRSSTSHQIL